MSEYIGSHISLISKSDIRYIGTLHEINSETSTVALENVKSYGTEGRRGNPNEDIPGSDQVYEYIVFRGSDVKELNIMEAPKENKAPSMPNDPAILGSARPMHPQQGPPQHQQPPFQQPPHFQQPYDFQQGPPPPHFQQPPPRFQNNGGPHGFPGQPGSVPSYNPGFGGPPPNFGYGPPGQNFHGPPGYNQPHQAPIAPPPQQQRPQQPPKGEGPQPVRANTAQKPAEMSATPTPVSAAQKAPPPPLASKPDVTAQTAATSAVSSKPEAKKAHNPRVAVPLPASAPKAAAKPTAPAARAPTSYADATSAATAAVAAAMAQLNTGPPQQTSSSAGLDNLTQKVNQMRAQDSRGRGRGRGRGDASARGGRRDQRSAEVPKEDFDFESSNAKFNKQDLVKQAIASSSPVTSPAADTEHINGLEDANTNGADTDDVVIPPKPSAEKSYDKKTSFFDNLSSDLRDRASGREVDGRAMRNQERTKNVETFGQGSVDSGRGGYRGRGRGRGFGRGRASAGAGYAARGAFNAHNDGVTTRSVNA